MAWFNPLLAGLKPPIKQASWILPLFRINKKNVLYRRFFYNNMNTRFVKWLSPLMDYVYFDDIFGSMDLCFQIQAWCHLCIGFSFCCSSDNCSFTPSSQTNQPVSLHSLWQLRMGSFPWNIIEATSVLYENLSENIRSSSNLYLMVRN